MRQAINLTHCWRKMNLQSWPRGYQSTLKNTRMIQMTQIQMTQMRLRSWLKPRWHQFAFNYFVMTILFRFRNHVNRMSFFFCLCPSLSLPLSLFPEVKDFHKERPCWGVPCNIQQFTTFTQCPRNTVRLKDCSCIKAGDKGPQRGECQLEGVACPRYHFTHFTIRQLIHSTSLACIHNIQRCSKEW